VDGYESLVGGGFTPFIRPDLELYPPGYTPLHRRIYPPYIRLSGGYIVGSAEPTSQRSCLSCRKNLCGCVHTLPGWKIQDVFPHG